MFDQIEKLKQELTDQYVVVNSDIPELKRFDGHVGQVKTVNMNGRALVNSTPGTTSAGTTSTRTA